MIADWGKPHKNAKVLVERTFGHTAMFDETCHGQRVADTRPHELDGLLDVARDGLEGRGLLCVSACRWLPVTHPDVTWSVVPYPLLAAPTARKRGLSGKSVSAR